ncbi:hypothetical protein ACFY71_29340 [Streptomyces cinerochromogenes]|uniref:hypothetical protein n=1 Tax=Streptomyces cinerochromogenes TaxID=66422 RepID=UPI0036ACA109
MPIAARRDGRWPKAVGDLLRSTLAGHALRPRDYQDPPLCRQLTGVFVAGLVRHAGGPVIVPMTVLNPGYTEEILTRLRQAGGFRVAVRAYRRRRAPDYHRAASDWMHANGHVIDISALTPEQALHTALDHLHLTAPARPRPPETPEA